MNYRLAFYDDRGGEYYFSQFTLPHGMKKYECCIVLSYLFDKVCKELDITYSYGAIASVDALLDYYGFDRNDGSSIINLDYKSFYRNYVHEGFVKKIFNEIEIDFVDVKVNPRLCAMEEYAYVRTFQGR